jgi:hypothetical protein
MYGIYIQARRVLRVRVQGVDKTTQLGWGSNRVAT